MSCEISNCLIAEGHEIMNQQRAEIERLTRQAAAIVVYSWVTTTRRLCSMWSNFRGLSTLEQVCWAFLAVVSVVCVTIRVLQ